MAQYFRLVCAALLCSLLFAACNVEKYGKQVGAGLSTQTDSIGRGLIAGLRDELTSPVTQQKLSRFLDSLIANITDTLGARGSKVEDSLLSPKVLRWADSLVTTVTGKHLQENMAAVQAALIGKTRQDVLAMRDGFRQLLNQVLSNDTRGKIGQIRDELLGPKTNAALTKIIDTAVTHIVDSAMTRVSLRLKNDINPIFQNDIGFVQRNATWLLVTIGAIAAGIIVLVWRNRQKYLHMLTIVAKQVHDIPDQNVYDKVTGKIKDQATSAGLESDLRDVLNKNGLLNTNDWVNKPKQ